MCFSPRYALENTHNLESASNSYRNIFSNRNHNQYLGTVATPVGIWLKHDTYREQPKVNFQYKVIFVAHAKEKINQSNDNNSKAKECHFIPKELYYSTIDGSNELRPETFRPASTMSREVDDDFDSVVDQLRVKIKMPLKENEYVYEIQAIVFVLYKLDAHVKMKMESLIYAHHESGLAGSKFSTIGDLKLRQMTPIPIIDTIRNGNGNVNNNDDHNDEVWTLFADDTNQLLKTRSKVANEYDVQSILQKYQSRSITTDYIERFPVWTRHDEYSHCGVDNSIDGNNSKGETYKKEFEFDLTVDIPKMQSVIYVPTLMEVLTEAWVRYLSFLVITGFCFQRLYLFVFTNHIIKSNVSVR